MIKTDFYGYPAAMSDSADPLATFDERSWTNDLVTRHGELIGGAALRSLLGFRTAAAFQKARLQGLIDVPLFTLPSRQGFFAVTEEACAWVLAHRRSAKAGSRGGMHTPGGTRP